VRESTNAGTRRLPAATNLSGTIMQFLRNRNLVTKLSLPVAILAVVMVGIILFAKSGFDTLGTHADRTTRVEFPRLEYALRTQISVNLATSQTKNIIIESDPAKMKPFEEGYRANLKLAFDNIDKLMSLSDTPVRQAATQKIREAVQNYAAENEKAVQAALKEDNDTAFALVNGPALEASRSVTSLVTEQIDKSKAVLAQITSDDDAMRARTDMLLIVLGSAGLVG
jgi:hypothetical protein